MTTWTMAQVHAASRLRASVVVDAELIARNPEPVQRKVAGKMGDRLIDMGHPLGIEIHPGDLEVVWETSDERPWEVTGRARWNPRTHEAELLGGHLDGQRYAIRNVGEPLRVPRPAVSPWFDHDAARSEATLAEIADTYELAGWREAERVWIYEAK